MVPRSLKEIYHSMPRFLKRAVLKLYEDYYRLRTLKELGLKAFKFPHKKNLKPRVLFYFVSGLGYGGVSKMLQEFAKALDFSKYDVYYMYSAKARAIGGRNDREDGRKFYLENTPITLIEHGYDSMDGVYPFIIRGMRPSLFEVLKGNNIDVLITTGSGYTEFPYNLVTDLPIINFNIFGSPAVQKNIKFHICISHEVAGRISGVVYPKDIKVMYIPTEGPPKESEQWGKQLREDLGFKDSDIVFGRIGRGVDGIFDPIGIRAFQKLVFKYPNIYYLIMSPPPILEKIVEEEKIPNVHFLPSSGEEKDIWGFHQAVDVLAHFRHDGESFGLNIAESMYCKKPIISHKSRYWNAHMEYLEPSFSFVADVDNVEQYTEFMEFFAKDKNKEKIRLMGKAAEEKAEMFHIKNFSPMFEEVIEKSLTKL